MTTVLLEFNETNVRRWMRHELQINPQIYDNNGPPDDINTTLLAENAAEYFRVKDEGGPLDDPDHWIWDLAFEAEAAHAGSLQQAEG